MGGCNAPVLAYAVDGAVGRLRRRKQTAARLAMPIAAIPPTTPPTIAPTFELLLVGEGEVEVEVEEVLEEPAALVEG